MNPLRRPRAWATAAACALIAGAAWLLLVPRTAVYLKEIFEPDPYQVSSVYSWGSRDQDLLYSDTGMSQVGHPVKGIRIDCGNSFSTGEHEQVLDPDGPKACAEIETPRTILGLVLFTLGAFGLPAARWLPGSRGNARYAMPYQQRRALRRSR
jgi:hypothetical protein